MRAWFVLGFLVLSGCLGGGDGTADVDDTTAPTPPVPGTVHTVIAVIDTGINPYNEAFRDDSPLAWQHPSTYIDGFPADAPALPLTFDAADYESAVLADCAIWQNVTAGQLYWVPGTRIVGAISWSQGDVPCATGSLPGKILDRGGHGTMTASRAAGNETGICPMCRIVAVQGFSTANMLWAAEQPWIDLQTNSWGTLPDDYVLRTQDRMEARAAAAIHPVFVSAGNGLGGFFGVTGHPIWYDGNTGPLGIIAVGAHDNGQFALWGATMPHVVADGMNNPSADPFGFGLDPTGGGGTSSAAPFAAGVMGRMIYELRHFAGDTASGVRDGFIVVGNGTGPLGAGLTFEAAKTTYFHSADAAVPEDARFDGAACPTSDPITCALYPAIPLDWSTTGTTPKYYFVGYGGVGQATWPVAVAMALGAEAHPDRSVEDQFYQIDNQVRDAHDQNQP